MNLWNRCWRLIGPGIVLWLCLAALHAYSQDGPPPEGSTPAGETASLTATYTPTLTPTPTQTPTLPFTPTTPPTDIPSETPTETPTATATTEPATPEVPATEVPAPGDEPSLTPTPELTASETPDERLTAPAPVWSPTATMIEEIKPTVESPTPEMTSETPGPKPTEGETPTPTASETGLPALTAAATMDARLVMAGGMAHYQNRLPDDGGIRVQAVDGSGRILSETVTNSAGAYALPIPAGQPFTLRIEGERHLAVALMMQPGELLPAVRLAGGDLNGDGCVGPIDLGLLTVRFEQPDSATADITGDGITDDADLAILAGNYAPACEEALIADTPTATPAAEVTDDAPAPEETASAEPTVDAEITLEPTADPTAEPATAEAITATSPAPNVDISPAPEMTHEAGG